jgi:hypothetical protein
MATVRVTTTVECQVAKSDDAHELGKELENRLHTTLNALIPNLRHARVIQSGTVKFSMEIEGRRLKIQVVDAGNQAAGIEPIDGAGKK